ncbi:hypothetical protein ACFVRT_15920 [Arthrobacter koreensis]|uniref:hypothetical protein n=1 Tax=Arthrobacter koreensis TaxID=199136 RepID=UPI0036DEAC7E
MSTFIPREPNGRFARKTCSEPALNLTTQDPADDAALLEGFTCTDARLDIWRRYPDISEEEDEATDDWACGEVSGQFAAYAREQGWDADVVTAQADHPMADEHVWVHLHRGGRTIAVDWTARQYHNLNEISWDPKVLSAPWPLTWNPDTAPNEHPLMGSFTLP